MALKDITQTEVKKAIDEYDENGPEKMFSKYGGGPSRTYHLEYAGKYYSQKLIIRVAHGFLPGKRPLKARGDGGGGTKSRKRLEQLGFTIISN